MDAETLQPQVEPAVQQLDQPEQDDEAQRDPGRQPEVGAGPLGAGVVRVGDMNLHRGTRYFVTRTHTTLLGQKGKGDPTTRIRTRPVTGRLDRGSWKPASNSGRWPSGLMEPRQVRSEELRHHFLNRCRLAVGQWNRAGRRIKVVYGRHHMYALQQPLDAEIRCRSGKRSSDVIEVVFARE